MSQFSSRPPFNADPEPYAIKGENNAWRYSADKAFVIIDNPRVYVGRISARLDPRPEFDRPQHNPTNPILIEFRKYAARDGNPPSLAAHWTKSEAMWAEMCLKDLSFVDEPIRTPEQEAHARKVLTRLAGLAKERG